MSGVRGLSGVTAVTRVVVAINFDQGIRMWSDMEAGLVTEILQICKDAMNITAQVHYMINF